MPPRLRFAVPSRIGPLRTVARALVVLALSTPATGCSILFVSGLPEDPKVRVGHRCASRALPALDAGLAGIGMFVLANGVVLTDQPRSKDLILGLSLVGVGVLSSAYGGSTIAECTRRLAREKAEDEAEEDDEEEPAAPASSRPHRAERPQPGPSDGDAPPPAPAGGPPAIRPAPPALDPPPIRPAPPATPLP